MWELLSQDYFYLFFGVVLAFLVSGLPIGFLLIHKNLGLFSDSLSHSLIPGLVGAVLLMGMSSLSLALGSVLWGILVAFLFTYLSGLSEKTRDSTLVAISLFGVSLGLILNQYFELRVDFTHLLFGAPLLMETRDFLFVVVISLIVAVVTKIYWSSLLLYCVDSVFAELKFGKFKINFIFSLLTTLLVVMGFQVFGVLLTTGLIVLPNLALRGSALGIRTQILLSLGGTLLLSLVSFLLSYSMNLTFSSVFVALLSLLSLIILAVKRSTRAR